MKVILLGFVLVLLVLSTYHLSKPPNMIQCHIGSEELFKFNLQNNKVPLIQYDQLQHHIHTLISSEPQFKNVRFINTETMNDASHQDTLIFNHGQCIKLLINDNLDVIAIAFLSKNYRMEWRDVKILIKVIAPFNSKERWYSSDIYKIAVNLYETRLSTSDENHLLYQYHFGEANSLFLLNKNNDKLTFFLFRKHE